MGGGAFKRTGFRRGNRCWYRLGCYHLHRRTPRYPMQKLRTWPHAAKERHRQFLHRIRQNALQQPHYRFHHRQMVEKRRRRTGRAAHSGFQNHPVRFGKQRYRLDAIPHRRTAETQKQKITPPSSAIGVKRRVKRLRTRRNARQADYGLRNG